MSGPGRKWKLGEILVQKGWVTWQQLEEALKTQQTPGKADPVSQSLCLGEILIKNGWLSWENLEKALGLQRQTGRILGEILVQHKFVLKVNLYRALALQFGRPFVDFSTVKVPPDVLLLIPAAFAREHKIMPLLKQNRIFLFATADPQNLEPEIELKKIITDCEIRFAIAAPEDLEKAIARYYP